MEMEAGSLEKLERTGPDGTDSATMDPVVRDIECALGGPLSTELFERVVVDLLRPEHPGLVSVRGGGDGGYDGAIPAGQDAPAVPLIVTTSKQHLLNFRKNLERVKEQSPKVTEAVFATSRPLTTKQRRNLDKQAQKLGVGLRPAYDRHELARLLRGRPELSFELLDVSGAPAALADTPVDWPKGGGELQLRGRSQDLDWLLQQEGDCLLTGQPGVGKTALLVFLAQQGKALFLVGMDEVQVANSVRSMRPFAVMVEDAHTEDGLRSLNMLQSVRNATRADFRIIASSLPDSYERDVRGHLNLADNAVHKLDRLNADVMAEIIKDNANNRLTDDGVAVVRSQADGRPGLAVRMTRLGLKGDGRQVMTGETLCRLLLAKIPPRYHDLLAALALGGNRGMRLRAVTEALGLCDKDGLDSLSGLRPFGVVEPAQPLPLSLSDAIHGREKDDGKSMAIFPQALRHELLKQKLPDWEVMGTLDKLMQSIQDEPERREAAILTLIGAAQNGGIVPRLREMVVSQQSDAVWVEYAYVDESTARDACKQRADLMDRLAGPLIGRAPDDAVPMLLDHLAAQCMSENGVSEFSLRPTDGTVLHQVREWTGCGPAQARIEVFQKLMENKRRVLEDASAWMQHQHNEDEVRNLPAVAFMCVAMLPTYEGQSTDPGMGSSVTLSSGLFPMDIIKGIGDMWPVLMKALAGCPSDRRTWNLLCDLALEWMRPRCFGEQPTRERADILQAVASNMLLDLAACSRAMPGVQMRLQAMASRLELDLGIDAYVSREYKVLNPLFPLKRSVDWEEIGRAAREEAGRLGREWADCPIREWVGMLREVAQAAEFKGEFGHGEDMVPSFCQSVAQEMKDGHVAAAEALLSHGFGCIPIDPFLRVCVERQETGWQNVLRQCLNSPSCAYTAVEVIMSDGCADAELGDEAFAALVKMRMGGDAGNTLAIRNQMPRRHLMAALRLADGEDEQKRDLALQVAIGHWYATKQGKDMDADVRPAWRKAIVDSAQRHLLPNGSENHWLGEMLAQDSELAFEWLRSAIASQKCGVGEDELAEKAMRNLDKAQRFALLDAGNEIGITASSWFFAVAWIPACVGDDVDVYRRLLHSPNLKNAHGLPLAGDFTKSWRDKALAALDAGMSECEVASWSGGSGGKGGFIGEMSDVWRMAREKFEAIQDDEDCRLRRVGRIGAARMQQGEEKAKRGEDMERMRGIGHSR